jgi:hypothetical protein
VLYPVAAVDGSETQPPYDVYLDSGCDEVSRRLDLLSFFGNSTLAMLYFPGDAGYGTRDKYWGPVGINPRS